MPYLEKHHAIFALVYVLTICFFPVFLRVCYAQNLGLRLQHGRLFRDKPPHPEATFQPSLNWSVL